MNRRDCAVVTPCRHHLLPRPVATIGSRAMGGGITQQETVTR